MLNSHFFDVVRVHTSHDQVQKTMEINSIHSGHVD